MMKTFLALTAGAALLTAATVASAQNTMAPGVQMQEKGSVKGSVKGSPGASGYTPGHQMQEQGSVKGTTGASGYAPGGSVKGDADVKASGKAGKTDIDAGAKAKIR